MNRNRILVSLIMMLFSSTLFADALDQSREVISQTNKKLVVSQKRINETDKQNMQMYDEYKNAKQEIKNYLVYNKQLQEIVDSQNKEIATLHEEIAGIEQTAEKVMPFMAKMIDGLGQFIASDFPFLQEERSHRLETLKANMKRADLSIASKYRQILEAYQIEIDYGKTIEAYEGELDQKRVNFLKVGRIGFYSLSFDKKHCAAWDQKSNSWKQLEDSEYTLSLSKAIKIAKKQSSPDLFFAALHPVRSRK
ncbi:MAG: DUF3450 domain-containing protein [Epsilonproteobacteria bacterium]|nr:DUF3450 domain-containing protein [Campylobacterota bacterium]